MISKVSLYIDDIFIDKIKLKEPLDIKILNDKFENSIIKYSNVDCFDEADICVYSNEYIWNEDEINSLGEISSICKNYISYYNFLCIASDNYFCDLVISKNRNPIPVGFTSAFMARNSFVFKSIFRVYQAKEYLTCYYLLRDLYENILFYSWYILFELNDTNKASNYLDGRNKIYTGKICENINIKFSEIGLEKDMEKARLINKKCDDYIHKNSYDKLNPFFVNTFDFNDVFFVLRLFIKVAFIYDGKSFSSPDYFDLLEAGLQPQEEMLHDVKPYLYSFIHNVYSKEEIDLLDKYQLYEMDIK